MARTVSVVLGEAAGADRNECMYGFLLATPASISPSVWAFASSAKPANASAKTRHARM
jgi:hypothetical protein